MPYRGIMIEESLDNPSILNDIKIIRTQIEAVTPKHKTPWINYWTMHEIEVADDKAKEIADRLSLALDAHHSSWYADFKNDEQHYIVFHGKVFVIDRTHPEQYEEAIRYGVSLGIPGKQLDFSPQIKI